MKKPNCFYAYAKNAKFYCENIDKKCRKVLMTLSAFPYPNTFFLMFLNNIHAKNGFFNDQTRTKKLINFRFQNNANPVTIF